MQKFSAGKTISGAKGNDATTAHGASVPSSGPYGTPRPTYPKNFRLALPANGSAPGEALTAPELFPECILG